MACHTDGDPGKIKAVELGQGGEYRGGKCPRRKMVAGAVGSCRGFLWGLGERVHWRPPLRPSLGGGHARVRLRPRENTRARWTVESVAEVVRVC